MKKTETLLAAIAADERGATAIEYALLASAIAAVITLAVIAVGQWLPSAFSPVVGGLP
jgi:Flp pilus assembly pilin Flp